MYERTSAGTVAGTEEGTFEVTLERTPEGTPNVTDGNCTDDDATGDSEEQGYEPPCRAAARYLTNCPLCSRRMSIRVLRYTHVCNRTFRAEERALEQQGLAEAKMLQRLAARQVGSKQSRAATPAVLKAGVKAWLDIGAQSAVASRTQSGKLSMLR